MKNVWALLFLTMTASAQVSSPELSLLAKCLKGTLSQPYETKLNVAKPRGQSSFFETVDDGHLCVHQFNAIVLPQILPSRQGKRPGEQDRIRFTVFYENDKHVFRTQSVEMNENALRPAYTSAARSPISFPDVMSTPVPKSQAATCPAVPLTLRVQISAEKKATKDSKAISRQFLMTPALTAEDVTAGMKNRGKVIASPGKESDLSAEVRDLADHVTYADGHLSDAGVPNTFVLNTIQKCTEANNGLKKLQMTPQGEFYRATWDFGKELDRVDLVNNADRQIKAQTAETANLPKTTN